MNTVTTYIAGAWFVGMSAAVVDISINMSFIEAGEIEDKAVNKVVREDLVPTISRIDENVKRLLERRN